MNADAFRLILALCVVALTVAIMGAVNPLALFIALVAAVLWLCWRVARWCRQRWLR